MHRFAHAALFVAGVSAAVVAGPLLDHSITSVTADGQGSHTVTTTITGTTTQSGIADRSGNTTVDQLDGPRQTLSGSIDGTTETGSGHFVNTIFGPVCNGHCPKP
jgi:hypothetical protein